jgi:hypothetical protein
MATATLTVARSSLDLADARFKGVKGPIDADLMWEVFCGIPEGIDRYLVLRDLLKVAPKVYYQLLLRHTESILPFIYTVRTKGCGGDVTQLPIRLRWKPNVADVAIVELPR